ncbi:hypothetical protein AB688_17980 [Pseudomonas putida]|nr:hypothetical protein AB688_17980 [Pseudomonas putida]
MHRSTTVTSQDIPNRPSSALRVAMARAVHQLLDDPVVFDDPYALEVLPSPVQSMLQKDPFQFNEPVMRSLRAAVVARSRYSEDLLLNSRNMDLRQYVILGAGLDTYALRNEDESLVVFEVDLHTTQEQKRKAIGGLSSGANSVRYVPCDLRKDALLPRLVENGLEAQQPVFVAWLGVTPYLTREQIVETLKSLAHLPEGSQIVFDYRVSPERLPPIERAIESHAANLFAQMGEPWLSSFDPEEMSALLSSIGFTLRENLDASAINHRYFARRKDGLQATGAGFRLLHAVRNC